MLSAAARAVVVAVSLLAVYMAGSRGGQVMSTVGIVSIAIAVLPKLAQRVALAAVLLLSVPIINFAAATFVVDADKIGIAGLTIDTNSRMKIWQYGFDHLDGNAIFGFGLGSFWTPDRLLAFKGMYGWVLDNFHNGYITILIEGGLVGFGLFMALLAAVYLLLVVAIGSIKDRFIIVSFAFVNMYAINNLAENEIGRSTSLRLFIFIILVLSIRRQVYLNLLIKENRRAKSFRMPQAA